MPIPANLIANADDLGLNSSVNAAILLCFEQGYINSASLMTNTPGFDEAIDLISKNKIITNIGIHVNLGSEGPVSAFKKTDYLTTNGNWDRLKVDKKLTILDRDTKSAFFNEICAQIEKALTQKITVTHLDSHFHLHTLPCFYSLFIAAAKKYNLKLRLAQTYNEGNYVKFMFRKYANNKLRASGINYSDRFETVERYLNTTNGIGHPEKIEVMLHPSLTPTGELTDHYHPQTMVDWINFLKTN